MVNRRHLQAKGFPAMLETLLLGLVCCCIDCLVVDCGVRTPAVFLLIFMLHDLSFPVVDEPS